jgi:hypothetical protein
MTPIETTPLKYDLVRVFDCNLRIIPEPRSRKDGEGSLSLINTTGWNDRWLRCVIEWCCEKLEYPRTRLQLGNFSLAHNTTAKGRVRLESHKIRVKINPLIAYPLTARPQRSLPPETFRDAIELLVHITAHEIAHLDRWDRFARELRLRGKRDTFCERETENMARLVLSAFRKDRENLLTKWGDSGPGPVPPPLVDRAPRACRRNRPADKR